MSIRVMTAVWDRGTRYAEGTLLVLLALADWADDGGRCFPSVPQIAKKSRLTERQVYRVLKDLKADGVLAACSGNGRRTVYQINTEMLSANRVVNASKGSGNSIATPDKMSGVRTSNADNISGFPERETPDIDDAKTPDARDRRPLTPASQTPDIGDMPINRTVIEPPTQPSGRTVSKNNSPYPLASEGVKKPHVDGMTWGRFRVGLKQQLDDAPLKHSNFRDVVKGECEFDACFRDWWLVGLAPDEGATGPPQLVTEAENLAATREGLRKYRKRIEALARQHFGAAVEIVVQERNGMVQ